MTDEPDKTGAEQGRGGRGRWSKGQSGNPAGRPLGSRHRATLAAQELLDGEAEALTRKAIDLAKGGDSTALRLCLERLLPPRKDRPVSLDVGKIETPADALAASGRVIEGLAVGDLTPSEAAAAMAVLEGFRRQYETTDLAARLAALEAAHNGGNG